MKKIIVWLLVFTLCACVTWWALDVRQRSEDMARDVEELRRKIMQTATTTWKSGGAEITVSTVRRDNESESYWIDRHKAAVDAMKRKYPQDV